MTMSTSRHTPGGIFDLVTPEQFFEVVRRVFARYRDLRAKSIEDLLFVLLGLTHLREWITPGYDYKANITPSDPAEQFSKWIYEQPSFGTVRALCNRTKHLRASPHRTSVAYGLNIDDWPDVDAVTSFDDGAPSGFFVDGVDVIVVIDEVISLYEVDWFSKQHATSP